MADKQGKRELTSPQANRLADAGRAVAMGLAGGVPVIGSLLAEAADFTLPNPTVRKRERWEGEVTDGVNALHGRVDELDQRTQEHGVLLEGPSACIAEFMVKHCPDGLARDDLTIEEIHEALPDLNLEAVREGLGELESYGLVSAMEFCNDDGFFTLAEASYEALDPPVMGWNPAKDAQQLATLALSSADSDGVTAFALEQAIDWPRRRFNPAFRILTNQIDPSCIDDTLQPQYVTAGFYLTPVDRARLRRFATPR